MFGWNCYIICGHFDNIAHNQLRIQNKCEESAENPETSALSKSKSSKKKKEKKENDPHFKNELWWITVIKNADRIKVI